MAEEKSLLKLPAKWLVSKAAHSVLPYHDGEYVVPSPAAAA
jgi:hypothetical protein